MADKTVAEDGFLSRKVEEHNIPPRNCVLMKLESSPNVPSPKP
jgi:hypothetical protein